MGKTINSSGSTKTVTAAFDELDFEYATSIAEKAVRSMAEHRVPPTPNNFHVWFNYTLGAPPVLKRAIDILIGELAKATTCATKLEVSFVEKSRELATIRDSLIKSEERAKTDTLTGLPNRRALEEFFRNAQIAAMERDDPVSALLIDID